MKISSALNVYFRTWNFLNKFQSIRKGNSLLADFPQQSYTCIKIKIIIKNKNINPLCSFGGSQTEMNNRDKWLTAYNDGVNNLQGQYT